MNCKHLNYKSLMKALPFLLPLLLWVELHVDVVMAGCIHLDNEYDDMERCLCTADSLQDPFQMFVCIHATELELQDGVLQLANKFLSMQDSPEISGLAILPLERILFTRVQIPGIFLSAFLNTLPKTNVHRLDFTDVTLDALPHTHSLTQSSPITHLQMDRVTFDPSLSSLNAWLLSSLTHVTLRGMPGMVRSLGNADCVSLLLSANLTELDLSENNLTDENLANLSRCLLSSSNPPPISLGLTVIRLSHNQLHTLQSLCPLLQASPHLVELDLSHNPLNESAFDSSCFNSAGEIKHLNLSHTGIQAADDGLIPASVEVLDLSGNQLREFRNPPQGISELYLSNNRLSLVPDLINATQLQFLTLDGNRLSDLSGGFTLRFVMERLSSFRAGGNPFTCGCEMRESVGLLKKNHDKVLDWPDAFHCTPPDSNSATLRLDDLDFSECDHQAVNQVSPSMKINVDHALCMSVVVIVSTVLL